MPAQKCPYIYSKDEGHKYRLLSKVFYFSRPNTLCYIPNSVLSEDIRSIVPKPPGKIYAIFKKDINSPLYTQLTYKAKNITITKKCLPEGLLNEIDSSLFEN